MNWICKSYINHSSPASIVDQLFCGSGLGVTGIKPTGILSGLVCGTFGAGLGGGGGGGTVISFATAGGSSDFQGYWWVFLSTIQTGLVTFYGSGSTTERPRLLSSFYPPFTKMREFLICSRSWAEIAMFVFIGFAISPCSLVFFGSKVSFSCKLGSSFAFLQLPFYPVGLT